MQTRSKIVIAIDGYSSCGKSTLAKALANELGYAYVDTGAMYRAATLYFIENGVDILNESAVADALQNITIDFQLSATTGHSEVHLNNKNVEKPIREMAVAQLVSKVSAIRIVRDKLVKLQQQMGEQKGVVMDGRDIGTTVFPHAELKLFMTASPEIRVKRRFDELAAKGQLITLEEVYKNIEQRDYDDTHRLESPLVQAADAIVIDNSHISQAEQLQQALLLVAERTSIR